MIDEFEAKYIKIDHTDKNTSPFVENYYSSYIVHFKPGFFIVEVITHTDKKYHIFPSDKIEYITMF